MPDYSEVARAGSEWVRVRFNGDFGGTATVWDATVMTLREACRRRLAAGGNDTPRLRAFIDVGAATTAGRALVVALPVAAIDAAAILKTITMIRNFKRLHVGRHEYGDLQHFSADCAPVD